MDSSNTKQQILAAALDLFSTQGYEATALSQIADAVGIRKASLYSHFAGKQEILDCLLQQLRAQYDSRSLFTRARWENPAFAARQADITPESVARDILAQIRYILHDPQISKARKMLLIEQFRNERMARLQTEMNYENVLRYFEGLMELLIRRGSLRAGDPEIMAAQLCLPITVWLGLCDREPDREEEVLTLMDRHVRRFFQVNGREA